MRLILSIDQMWLILSKVHFETIQHLWLATCLVVTVIQLLQEISKSVTRLGSFLFFIGTLCSLNEHHKQESMS